MIRSIFALLFLVAGSFAPSVVLAGQEATATVDDPACADVAAYLQDLDQLMFDPMADLFTDEDWLEDMDRMSRKADANDSGILTLTEEEMQPFIDIITIPGDTLLDYPEGDIPELALPLHESAMSYWLLMPAMMRSIASGGVFAAIAFTEDMEAAVAANNIAVQNLRVACPALVSEQTDPSLESVFDVALEDGADIDLDDVDASDLTGFAFSILALPSEESGD